MNNEQEHRSIRIMREALEELGYYVLHHSRVKSVSVQFSLGALAYTDEEMKKYMAEYKKGEAVRAIAAELAPRLHWVEEEDIGGVKCRTSLTYVEKADGHSHQKEEQRRPSSGYGSSGREDYS